MSVQRCFLWLVALSLISAIGCAQDNPAARRGPTPPGLFDLDGKPFDLFAREKGRICVVIFTRTDCPISNRFAPEIRRLQETYHPRGVDLYLVYVDSREEPQAIRRHLQEYRYGCPGLRDPEHSLVAYCHAAATAEAVVFNGRGENVYQGRITDQYVAAGTARAEATRHDLEDAIKSTLMGQAVATPRTRAIGCSIADVKGE